MSRFRTLTTLALATALATAGAVAVSPAAQAAEGATVEHVGTVTLSGAFNLREVAVDEGLNRAYVMSNDNAVFSIVGDGSSGGVIKASNIPGTEGGWEALFGIAVDPVAHRVYAGGVHGQVKVLNGNDVSHIKNIQLPTPDSTHKYSVLDVAVDAPRRLLYAFVYEEWPATESSVNRLWYVIPVDLETESLLPQVEAPQNTTRIAVDVTDGDLFMAGSQVRRVTRSGVVTDWNVERWSARSIGVDPISGQVFSGIPPSGSTTASDLMILDGDVRTVVQVPGEIGDGIGVSGISGRAFMPDLGAEKVSVVSPAGLVEQTVSARGAIDAAINGSNGLVYVPSTRYDEAPVNGAVLTIFRDLGSRQTAAKTATTTSLSSSKNPSVSGQSVTFTAQVVPTSGGVLPSGSVSFAVDGVQQTQVSLSGGQATWSTSALAVGTRQVDASYGGSTTFAASSATPLSQTVTAPLIATTTTVASSLNPSRLGDSVTLTAQVTAAPGAEPATGSVVFTIDGNPQAPAALFNGSATWTSTSLTVGDHAITAAYSGSASHDSSTSQPLTQTVSQPPAPDLLVTALGDAPAVTAPGQRFSVSSTTTNSGGATAGRSTTRFYAMPAGGAAGMLLSGTQSVASLVSGAGATATTALTLPTTLPEGEYHLRACADDLSAVAESNEGNNCRSAAARLTVVTPRPDLTVSALQDPPLEQRAGGTFSVSSTTSNTGSANSAKSTTSFLLVPEASDAPVTRLAVTRSVGGLKPGGASTGSITATLPSDLAVGGYRVRACADDPDVNVEAREDNNCRTTAAVIQVHNRKPDLAVSSLTDPPTLVPAGGRFTLYATTVNNGGWASTSSTNRFYLSATQEGPRILLSGSSAVPALSPGARHTGNAAITVPTSVGKGQYLLWACADDLRSNVEEDESNNCTAARLKLQVG